MRVGVRLGVDVGRARVGLARSDRDGLLATPVTTLQRGTDDGALVNTIAALVEETGAVEVIVGLPLSMAGRDTASTTDSRDVATLLARAVAVPVRLVDERLTTVSAQAALHASGRNTRNSRGVIDQVAAVILLQHALDVERSAGRPPGAVAEPIRK